jgi:hypothetical protein
VSGKDDAVDKEIERLLAKERNEVRFSKRPYLFVLGSGDRDYAQAARECSLAGVPVMVLAQQGAVSEAFRRNFDFDDDGWKQIMHVSCGLMGRSARGSLKRELRQPIVAAVPLPVDGRVFDGGRESDFSTAIPIAATSTARGHGWGGGSCFKMRRSDETGLCSWNATSTASTSSSAVDTESKCDTSEWKGAMVSVDKGADRELILRRMELSGISPDAYTLSLVLSGYFTYSDRARVLKCRRAFLTCELLVKLLSSEDIGENIEDALQFASSLPDELLCNYGVAYKLLPICAHANNQQLLTRVWRLGSSNLSSWPGKLISKLQKSKNEMGKTRLMQFFSESLSITVD